MTDFLAKLVLDHGLAAVLGTISIALQLWMAKWVFANLRGINASNLDINRDLARLLERNGMDSISPPVAAPTPRRRRGGVIGLLPRGPTPLPFWPVPQPDEPKEEP